MAALNNHSMVTRSKNGIFKSKVFLTDYKEIEPTTAKDVLKHSH